MALPRRSVITSGTLNSVRKPHAIRRAASRAAGAARSGLRALDAAEHPCDRSERAHARSADREAGDGIREVGRDPAEPGRHAVPNHLQGQPHVIRPGAGLVALAFGSVDDARVREHGRPRPEPLDRGCPRPPAPVQQQGRERVPALVLRALGRGAAGDRREGVGDTAARLGQERHRPSRARRRAPHAAPGRSRAGPRSPRASRTGTRARTWTCRPGRRSRRAGSRGGREAWRARPAGSAPPCLGCASSGAPPRS